MMAFCAKCLRNKMAHKNRGVTRVYGNVFLKLSKNNKLLNTVMTDANIKIQELYEKIVSWNLVEVTPEGLQIGLVLKILEERKEELSNHLNTGAFELDRESLARSENNKRLAIMGELHKQIFIREMEG